MRCAACDYPLWNLTDSRCPECGEHFDVREWRFRKGKVTFHCPKCRGELESQPCHGTWTTCPTCGKKFHCGSVCVTPTVDDLSDISWRPKPERIPPRFSFGVLIVAIFLGACGVFLLNAYGAPVYNPPQGLLLLEVIAGAGIAVLGVGRASRESRPMNIIVWMLLAGIWSVLITGLYQAKVRDHEHLRWWKDARSSLLAIRNAVYLCMVEHDELPSLKLLVSEEYAPLYAFVAYKTGTSLNDIMIGSYSLADFAAGRVTPDQFWVAARENPVKGEWESVGDYIFSRSFDAHTHRGAGVIVGVSTPFRNTGQRYVIDADGIYGFVTDGDGWIAAQNAVRAALGLDPLPTLP